MALPLYLAMTAAEITGCGSFPNNIAYMACHFSPYATGLSNLPESLPNGSMLIVNDRIPWCGHDVQLITNQLVELVDAHGCSSVLLDFQRPECEEVAELAHALVSTLPCTVGVSLPYAEGMDCPVFLPPVLLDMTIEAYLASWQGREIWLEAARDALEIRLKENGAVSTPLPYFDCPSNAHRDDSLLCHYQIELSESVRFTLCRSREDLTELLEQAESLGVTQAVGLWQELRQLN